MLDNLTPDEKALIEKHQVRFKKRANHLHISIGLEETYSLLAIGRKLSRDCTHRGFEADIYHFALAYTAAHITGTVCPKCGKGLVYLKPGIYGCDSCMEASDGLL